MNRRHSILFVSLVTSGSGRLLSDLLRFVDLERYRITLLVLTGGQSREEVPACVRLIAGDYFSSLARRIAGIFAIARLCRSHDTIVTYAELTSTYMTILGALMAFKRPIGAVHNHLSTIFRYKGRSPIHRACISLLYPALRKIIACSDGVADDLRRAFGLKNVVSIPNSVDIDRIRALSLEPMPAGFSPLFDRPVVMAIGVLGFQKGHDVLLRAFAHVKRAGYPHRLIIAGEGEDRDKLRTLIQELGLSDAVELIGYIRNPFPLLRRADLFVLSSRFEGFALVLAEAMALGVPIVSTDCNCGPREVLAQGRCGVLVPVDNVEELAAGVMKVLSNNELASSLRAEGLNEVKKRDVRIWSPRFIDAIVGL